MGDFGEISDSVFIDIYTHYPSTFPGKKRTGAHQTIVAAGDKADRISKARKLPNQVPEPAPPPVDFRNPLGLLSNNDDRAINDIWAVRINDLLNISAITRPVSDFAAPSTPESIRIDIGKLNFDLLDFLMMLCGMGREFRPAQFAYGFPSVWCLFRNYVYRKSGKFDKSRNNVANLSETSGDRFRKRSRRAVNGQDVSRDEASAEVKGGWVVAGGGLSSCEARLSSGQKKRYIPISRLSAPNPDRIRPIDDFRDGVVNQYCHIDLIFVFPRWGRVVAMCGGFKNSTATGRGVNAIIKKRMGIYRFPLST